MNCVNSPNFYFSDWPVYASITNSSIKFLQRNYITQILKQGFELALIELLTIGNNKNILAVLFPYTYVLIQQVATNGSIALNIVCMKCNSRQKYTGLPQVPSPDVMYIFLSRWFECTNRDEERDMSFLFLNNEKEEEEEEKEEEEEEEEEEKEKKEEKEKEERNKKEEEWNNYYVRVVQTEIFVRKLRKRNKIIITSIEIVKQIYQMCGPLLTCFPYDNIEAIDLINNSICLSIFDTNNIEQILEYKVFCLKCCKLFSSFSFNHTDNSNNFCVDQNNIAEYLQFIGNSCKHYH